MSENKIIITCDSTHDLGEELCQRYNIRTLPLLITLGDDVYRDGEVSQKDVFEYYNRTGKLARTATQGIEFVTDFFKQFTDQGYTVINFCISSDMSGSHNICRLAAEELDNVYTVDSRNLSTGIGLQLIHAAEMIEKGASAEEIVKEANELSGRVDASFIIDTLEYLYKGGRCSGVAALGANLLKLKPCIEVKAGKMGVGKKYRGKLSDVMLTYAADRLADADDIITDHVFVTHTMLDQAVAERVAEEVRKLIPCKELHITRAGCTIASHCGPNTLGVLFIRKTPLV